MTTNAPTDTAPITGLSYSSDYKLNLAITTSDGQSVQVENLLLNFNLYEDIFSPTMSGDFDISDAHDIFTSFSFQGNEYIYLELDKPSLNKPIKKYFRIYKVSDRQQKTQSLQVYRVHFCSEELLLSTQMLLRKSYKGMTIDSMINDILNNVLKVPSTKTKNGLFSKTGGNFNIIIPKMQPLEAVQWLTTRAYNDNQTLYFFFENRDGYNFTSYENLISKGSFTTFYRAPKVTTEPDQNIKAYNYINIVHDFDTIKTNRFGGFATSLYTYDIVKRKYVKNTFTLPTLGPSNFLNKFPIINSSQNRFNKSLFDTVDSMQKFYPTTDSDTSTNPIHPERWINQHAIKLAQLHQLKVVLNVPLDVQLKAGQVITLNLPKMTPQSDTGGYVTDKYKSGNYLVSSVRHGISDQVATTTLELLSDSLPSQLPTASTTSSGLQTIKSQ